MTDRSAYTDQFQQRQSNVLTLTLQNGILLDSQGRTGYIAANSQFQFDKPAQTGAIYTAGWSVCSNGSLAIGGTTIFQQCLSGNFYNLYLENTAPQCSPIYIQVYSAPGSSGAASQLSDGQPQATPQPLCQISDGQIQLTSCVPVTQISDGQIQATSARSPVTQISDGQIQGPTSKAAAPVTQISDGQIQAPTSKAVAPVTQISDGQIQAPTSKAVVSQISDGQVQAPTAASATATTSRAVYTGAAVMPTAGAEIFGLAAGILAVAML